MSPTARRPAGPAWLEAKLAAGGVIVIDGAMGTELQARGVPMHERAWSGVAQLSHPEVVRAIHADYIEAGAEVVITNTFASGRQMLDAAGLADRIATINRRAVEIAFEAREQAAQRPVAVAGSMCEWVDPESPMAHPERLAAAYREQAGLLAEAGVDLLALEMTCHPVHSGLLVEAALATGLPVWLGASCRTDESGALVGFDWPRADFETLVAGLAGSGVAVINVMHSTVEDTAKGLAAVRRHWSGPVGGYPESGHFKMPNWQFVDVIEPDDLVREAQGWVESGARIVGGCCGLGVAHVRALAHAFG